MPSKVCCLRHDIDTPTINLVKRNPSLFVPTYRILSLMNVYKRQRIPKGQIKNGQFRETGNKTKKNKTNKIEYVLDTTMRKQTQII